MAKIPVYDNLQVMPNILPGNRLEMGSIQNTGAQQAMQMGDAMLRSGQQLGGLAAKLQEEDNRLRLESDMAPFVVALTDLEAQSKLVLGKDATEKLSDGKTYVETYQDQAEKLARSFESNMDNEAQKQAWRQQTAGMLQGFGVNLVKHRAAQSQVVHKATQKADIEAAQYRGSVLWGDPDAIAESRAAIEFTVQQQLQEEGLSGDQDIAHMRMIQNLTPLHVGVLNGMVDGNRVGDARQYYEANKDTMSLSARESALKAMEEADTLEQAQRTADSIRSRYATDPVKQLEAARQLTGKERDQVVARILKMQTEDKAMLSALHEQNATIAWEYADNGRGDQIPPSVLANMDRKDREALDRVMVSGVPDTTNVDKWLEFTNLPPSALSRMTIQELRQRYWGYFKESDLRQANNILLSMKGAATGGASGGQSVEAQTLMTKEQIIAKTAVDLEINKPEGDKKNDAAYWDFHEKFDARVNAWQANNPGKKADTAVLKVIASEMTRDQIRVQKRFWFDAETSAVTASEDQLGRAYVLVGNEQIMLSSIPATQQAVISDELRLQGLPVTQQAIANYWVKAGKPQ